MDIVHTRDADGRIASISNGTLPIVTAIRYLPFGPATQYTYAGGQTLAKNYDARKRGQVLRFPHETPRDIKRLM